MWYKLDYTTYTRSIILKQCSGHREAYEVYIYNGYREAYEPSIVVIHLPLHNFHDFRKQERKFTL